MKDEITKLIIVAVLFYSYNFTAFSQATVEFETITEALNYDGDRNAVKKLIITGTISGNDYSEDSEWSKFRMLDETFPNIEEVEILTSQDIPDGSYNAYYDNYISLFYNGNVGSNWLKSFSAPNVKTIGSSAFRYCSNLVSINLPAVQVIGMVSFMDCYGLISINFPAANRIGASAFFNCENLSSINFPSLETIETHAFCLCISLTTLTPENVPLLTKIDYVAFGYCSSLKTINLPIVKEIGWLTFTNCFALTSVRLGTDLTTPTYIISFGNMFGETDSLTPYVDLILGENVLPLPDLEAKTWGPYYNPVLEKIMDYVWKSITIETSGIAKEINDLLVNVYPNPTSDFATLDFELENSCNMKIVLCDILGQELVEVYDDFTSEGLFTRTFSTEHLAKGVYFLKILLDGNLVVEKIVLN